MNANTPDTVTATEAAAVLGISRAGVSYLVGSGRVNHTRDVMGRLQIDLSSVVAYRRTRPHRQRGPRAAQITA